MGLVWGAFLGALIGWIGSLVMRSSTSENILLDVMAGLFGALALELLLANSGVFDNLAAGYMGAVVALLILSAIRHLPHRESR